MNRITQVITICAIVCLAVAGIGLAYAYTASTANTGNSAGVEYLQITPSDGTDSVYSGSFTTDISLNTRTVLTDKGEQAEPRYVEEVIYELDDYETLSGHKYANLGHIYLTIDEQSANDDYVLKGSVEDGTGLCTDDYTYKILFKIGSADTPAGAKTAAEGDTGTLVAMTSSNGDMVAQTSTIVNDEDNTHTVVLATLYASLNGGDTYTKALADPVESTVLDGVTFVFTVIAN